MLHAEKGPGMSTDHVSQLDVRVGGKFLHQGVVVSGEQTTTAN